MTGAVPARRRVLRTSAPAKLNLGLRVTAVRADGFHELRSVFLRLELADDLALVALPDGPDRLIVEDDADCPVEGNLVLVAARAFRAAAGAGTIGPVGLSLRKRIPMAAGLAGGSSDAAATLRLLDLLHPGAVEDARWVPLATSIGADVPFFRSAVGAALVGGVGSDVEPLPPPIDPVGLVLVRPSVGLATRRVFDAWDALHAAGVVGLGDPAIVERLAAELRAGATPATLVGLAPLLRDANDLWPAAVAAEPRMGSYRDALEARLGMPVLMTGSGSTLFALLPDAATAQHVARGLVDDPPDGLGDAWVTASASGTPYPPGIVAEEESQ